MQAWGTVAGALFSALAVFAAVGLLWHEIQIRRRDDLDRTAAQARLVVPRLYPGYQQLAKLGQWVVTNYSTAPIQNVELAIMQRGSRSVSEWGSKKLIRPGGSAREDWETAPAYTAPEVDGMRYLDGPSQYSLSMQPAYHGGARIRALLSVFSASHGGPSTKQRNLNGFNPDRQNG